MAHHPGDTTSFAPSSPNPIMSSSPVTASTLRSPTRTSHRKEKRNPSITPRRFGRFFTPRSNVSLTLPTSRRILGSLDSSTTNRQPFSPHSVFSDPLASDPVSPSSPTRRFATNENGARKRKLEHASGSVAAKRQRILSDMPPPPLNFSPRITQPSEDGEESTSSATPAVNNSQEDLSDRRKATLSQFFKASRNNVQSSKDKTVTEISTVIPAIGQTELILEGYEPTPIRKFGNRGIHAQLLDREHGYSSHTGRQYMTFPAADHRRETASFYSRSSDTHQVTAQDERSNTIPFSLASCHNASVTAIGDEEGCVRFFKTSMTNNAAESKVDAHFQVHDNAIMDLAFSEDDMRLATACGDRTANIVDTATQSVAAELGGNHYDSLRQVSFQPGSSAGNVLATSDRAGRIQVWDLRCSAIPTGAFSTVGPNGLIRRDSELEPFQGRTINTLDNAHERIFQGKASAASVTAIHWLPTGREHLILSASEANASIKLWDTRYIKPRRQVEETPLAVTLEPTSHAWRPYGITSLALSSDASRLYAVCKDSTIYAYSMPHLMLGQAPELLDGAVKRKPTGVEGLGPIYGFKHESFRAQSFYVKCAIRPGRNAHSSELLAVGSSDSCAVLFPTDERYLRSAWAQRAHLLEEPVAPTPSQSFSSSFSAPATSNVPIYRAGTSLIRGHSREVTTLSWAHDGKLVTASDDYIVRQWQEDEKSARYLRQVGEFGGERHMAGWADVSEDWDAEDDEE